MNQRKPFKGQKRALTEEQLLQFTSAVALTDNEVDEACKNKEPSWKEIITLLVLILVSGGIFLCAYIF